MFSLTITERAAVLIRKEVERSQLKRPAVYLLEVRDGIPPPQELERMPLSDAKRRELMELAAKIPCISGGEKKLVPCVYPRIHFLGLFLVKISDIVFFMPPELRRKASGGILDIGQGALVLLDSKGHILMPH